MTGEVSGQKLGLLMRWIVGVDERGEVRGGVVVVLIVVLLDLAVHVSGVGGSLAAGGNVIAAQNPAEFFRIFFNCETQK